MDHLNPGPLPSFSMTWSEASSRTIHAVVGSYRSIRDQVMANRGLTLQSTSTRRAPNCFNFLRQVEVLSRAGHGTAKQQFEDARTEIYFPLVQTLPRKFYSLFIFATWLYFAVPIISNLPRIGKIAPLS